VKKSPRKPKKKPQTTSPPKTGEARLQSAGVVFVEHQSAPPSGPADKQIHPRRPLPLVPVNAAPPTKEEDDDKV
jgi:hypothetical protein